MRSQKENAMKFCIYLRKMFKTPLFFAALILLSSLVTNAYSATWQQAYYAHFSKNETLVAVLQDFASTVRVPLVFSSNLKDADLEVFNGNIEGKGKQVLDKLSRIYNLQWYYDNHMIYFYMSDEAETKLIALKNITPILFKESLIESNVYDSRFSWQPVSGVSSVIISGPPRYITLVSQIAKMMDGLAAKTEKNAHTVRVFHLQHAWARDRVMNSRGERIVVPGVATSVQRILARESNPLFLSQTQKSSLSNAGKNSPASWAQSGGSYEQASNGATGIALKGAGLTGSGLGSLKNQSNPGSPEQILSSPAPGQSYVEASPQQNAVIVYDLESRMPLYESLIAALDVASDQVEIEVSIIDIKTDRLKDLGIAWQANGSDAQGGFGQAADVFAESSGAQALFGDKVNLSTIMAGQVDYFMGRVRALAKDGDGQILSQPTVLTIDNQEAFIDNSTTFFVRLQGQEEVDLVPITVGSVLRVTPRIMKNKERISLSVDISDGERSGSGDVDNIPSISTSHINTQAVVEASSSLLVGGYYFDQSISSEEKIPILGDIPLLKLLFSNTQKSRVKVARLFLITPRVVTSDPAQPIYARSNQLQLMVEREKSFHGTDYKEPKLSIFD